MTYNDSVYSPLSASLSSLSFSVVYPDSSSIGFDCRLKSLRYDFSRFVLVYIGPTTFCRRPSDFCRISSSGSISPNVQWHDSIYNGL